MLYSAQWLGLGALLSGTDDAKTIVNSVLGETLSKAAWIQAGMTQRHVFN